MVVADQHRSGSAVNGSSTPVRQSRVPAQWQIGAMSGEMRSRENEFCLRSTQIRVFLVAEGDRDATTPFTSTPHGGRSLTLHSTRTHPHLDAKTRLNMGFMVIHGKHRRMTSRTRTEAGHDRP